MDKTEIKIASNVAAKLVNQRDVVFLLGWAEGNTIICIGCARDIKEWKNITDFRDSAQQIVSLFPAGVGIVGFCECCPDEVAVDRSQTLFNQFLSNDVEDSVVGPILAFVFGPSVTEAQQALAFDARMARSTPALLRIVEGPSLTSNTVQLRISGSLPLAFETSDDPKEVQRNIEKAFGEIKQKVSSPTCVYRLQNSTVLIGNCIKNTSSHPKLKSNSKCSALTACVEEENEDDGFQSAKQKKKNSSSSNKILNLRLLVQTTGDAAVEQTLSCSPIIRYERREFKNVSMTLGIDVVAMVPSAMMLSDLPSLITNGICTQLCALQHTLCEFHRAQHRLHLLKVYHYFPSSWNHSISVIYPEHLPDSELETYRQEFHVRLLLPLDRPALRKSMQYSFPSESAQVGYLRNVHLGLPPSGVPDGQLGVVHGIYSYHHYMQDRMDDSGWGCAYRSLQTLISWFVHQGYTHAPIPTHAEIQQALVDIGDKPQSFVKSRKWIGSMEVSYCLDKLIGITSKIIAISSGAELSSKGRELLKHFEVHGTPIMIGGGVLAHTILGVDVNLKTGDIKFLILDPHYTGGEDLSVIQAKGWCGWKGPTFWDQTAYYNLCCPQRPPGI